MTWVVGSGRRSEGRHVWQRDARAINNLMEGVRSRGVSGYKHGERSVVARTFKKWGEGHRLLRKELGMHADVSSTAMPELCFLFLPLQAAAHGKRELGHEIGQAPASHEYGFARRVRRRELMMVSFSTRRRGGGGVLFLVFRVLVLLVFLVHDREGYARSAALGTHVDGFHQVDFGLTNGYASAIWMISATVRRTIAGKTARAFHLLS
jgi:hypothetical protein